MAVLARVTFIALIVVTVSAFFVSQRIKSAPAAVDIRQLPAEHFSPLAKGERSVTEFGFRLKNADRATVIVTNPHGEVVRRLVVDHPMQPYRYLNLSWNGRDDKGKIADNGRYWVRISLREQRRSLVIPTTINLSTTPPSPRVVSVKPDLIGSEKEKVTAKIKGINPQKATLIRILRTDVKPVKEVARFEAPAGSDKAVWNGRVAGKPAPQGTYMLVPQVEDKAGNIGSTPAHIPPLTGEIKGSPGITVRRLAVQPPLRPVAAGANAEFFVDSRSRRYRFYVRRLGQRRILTRGSREPGKPLIINAPSDRSGVYFLEVNAGSDTTRVPFIVQASEASRLLVVLPAITWVGSDMVDDEPRDGLPNELLSGKSAKHARVLFGDQGNGLPTGFSNVAPLLMYLDQKHISYDLTSDLALSSTAGGKTDTTTQSAGSVKPNSLEGHTGVILLGPFRWVTNGLAGSLRSYIDRGGRVASFGSETLRRGVTLTKNELKDPTPAGDTDIFGFKLAAPKKMKNSHLSALHDSSTFPLLTGTDGSLHGFNLVEESLRSGSGSGSRPLVAVGKAVDTTAVAKGKAGKASGTDGLGAVAESVPEPRPALEVVRRRKGYLIRVGLPEWPQRIRHDPKVAQITHNIADLLRGEQPRVRTRI